YDHVLVTVTDGQGRVGTSDVTIAPAVVGETTDGVREAVATFAPHLIGLSAFQVREAHRRMNARVLGNVTAKAAIDHAMFSVMAQQAMLPMHALLGGSTTDSLPTVCILGIGDSAETVATAEAKLAEGFSTFKVKVGLDPVGDV